MSKNLSGITQLGFVKGKVRIESEFSDNVGLSITLAERKVSVRLRLLNTEADSRERQREKAVTGEDTIASLYEELPDDLNFRATEQTDSKKLSNHIGAIKYFICHYNLQREHYM